MTPNLLTTSSKTFLYRKSTECHSYTRCPNGSAYGSVGISYIIMFKGRRISEQRRQLFKLRNTASMTLEQYSSLDENLSVVMHSSSTSKVPNGLTSQSSVDSSIQIPTVSFAMSPFFADQQEIVNSHQRYLIESSWRRSRKVITSRVIQINTERSTIQILCGWRRQDSGIVFHHKVADMFMN